MTSSQDRAEITQPRPNPVASVGVRPRHTADDVVNLFVADAQRAQNAEELHTAMRSIGRASTLATEWARDKAARYLISYCAENRSPESDDQQQNLVTAYEVLVDIASSANDKTSVLVASTMIQSVRSLIDEASDPLLSWQTNATRHMLVAANALGALGSQVFSSASSASVVLRDLVLAPLTDGAHVSHIELKTTATRSMATIAASAHNDHVRRAIARQLESFRDLADDPQLVVAYAEACEIASAGLAPVSAHEGGFGAAD